MSNSGAKDQRQLVVGRYGARRISDPVHSAAVMRCSRQAAEDTDAMTRDACSVWPRGNQTRTRCAGTVRVAQAGKSIRRRAGLWLDLALIGFLVLLGLNDLWQGR